MQGMEPSIGDRRCWVAGLLSEVPADRKRQQWLGGKDALSTAFELIAQDAIEDIAPEWQIKMARQHSQAGQRFLDRPFAVVLGEAAVVMQPSVPIFQCLSLQLWRSSLGCGDGT